MLDSFLEDIEGSTHCITDYLNFCLDAVVTSEMFCEQQTLGDQWC